MSTPENPSRSAETSPRAGVEGVPLRERALLFLHIHKTAGTTLHRILEAQYNPFRIYTIEGGASEWSIRHFRNLSERRRAALRVVKGHMSYGLHESLPQPSTYITFLRDPVERWISAYSYARSNPLGVFRKRFAREQIDLVTYLNLTPWNNNLQCKVLAGLERSQFRPRVIFEAATVPGAAPPDPAVDSWSNPQTFERAKANLERSFSLVGLTERFAESLVLLRQLFGWNLDSYSSHRRSPNRPKRESIPPEVLAEIQKRNGFDVMIYEFGRELFERALARAEVDVAREAAAFKAEKTLGPIRSAGHLGATGLRAAASRLVSIL